MGEQEVQFVGNIFLWDFISMVMCAILFGDAGIFCYGEGDVFSDLSVK